MAELYGVPTKRFNEQVKRNIERFPADFMFQLTNDEHESLRSQFATSNAGRGGRRYSPYAFTESLNSLIQVMNRMGRGYSFEALRAKILFSRGAHKSA
ncbi:ORF6N domain-containing protein, partial [Ferrovum sp.]|uniref:ORF6N domain-containing protein n=1 Tax=Ferrovum sp. TaxID=2609467 RepID=UPI002618F551